jgi:hypothetical protein
MQLREAECQKLESLREFYDLQTLKKKFINFKKVASA